ncbi:hypothetical protein [Glycomyces harbinensis]|uniref:hypothetical protein n=1 Tax=Glycomyces harbinensis TaxID=58114 RepID=UPI00115FA5B2|nr:hypothetical protein [Glycomyces harbinensis]
MRRPRVGRLLAIAFVLATAAATTVTAVRTADAWSQAEAPQRAVRDFLQASLDGDVEAALALVTDPDQNRSLLVPEALDADWEIDGLSLIEPVRSLGPGSNAESATVRATVRGPEDTVLSADFALVGGGGDWKVLDPFGRVRASRALVPYFEVNGHRLELSEFDDEALVLPVLPGLYTFFSEEISVLEPAHGPLLLLGDQAVEIGSQTQGAYGGTAPFEPAFKLRDDIEEPVQEHVEAYLEDCAARAGVEWPPECPFGLAASSLDERVAYSVLGTVTYADAAWTVAEHPEAVLTAPAPRFDQGPLRLTFRSEGSLETVVHVVSTHGWDYYGMPETVEYDPPAEYVFSCPLWILDLQVQITGDGGFAIAPVPEPPEDEWSIHTADPGTKCW